MTKLQASHRGTSLPERQQALTRFVTRPLYLQVRDALVEYIATGQWKIGSNVPNEIDLAREFGVSPGTMRKALDQLEGMGLVTRHSGRGTFVNDPAGLNLGGRFSKLRGSGGTPISDDVVSQEISEGLANELECQRLRLTKGVPVFRCHRRRRRSGKIYMVEDASMPAALFPSLVKEQNPPAQITALAMQHRILLDKAEERIAPGILPLDVAEALGISTNAPVLQLDRVVFTVDGTAAEWRVGWCHLGDGEHYLASLQ